MIERESERETRTDRQTYRQRKRERKERESVFVFLTQKGRFRERQRSEFKSMVCGPSREKKIPTSLFLSCFRRAGVTRACRAVGGALETFAPALDRAEGEAKQAPL